MDKLFVNALYAAFDAAAPDFVAAGLPPVATIDKYRGQPLHPDQFEYFELPALFFSTKIKWSKTGRLYSGVMWLTFHIVLDKTWEISNIATNRDIGLQQTDLLELIRLTLDSVKSANTGNMVRSDEDELDADVVTYQTMTYYTSYTEPNVSVKPTVPGEIDSFRFEPKLVTNIKQ